MSQACGHRRVRLVNLEHCYGFLLERLEICSECNCTLASQWYKSDDCGETWTPCENPMEDDKCMHQ